MQPGNNLVRATVVEGCERRWRGDQHTFTSYVLNVGGKALLILKWIVGYHGEFYKMAREFKDLFDLISTQQEAAN